MDWTDIGDVAAFAAVASAIFGLLSWAARHVAKRVTLKARRWIQLQLDSAVGEITRHLTNDEKSVAVYAHEARDAARDSKSAALDAKSAALDAKDAARQALATAGQVALVVERIEQRLDKEN